MSRPMTYMHKLSVVNEEWLISRIDKKHHNEFTERKTTITVTATSVIIKDGVTVLKRKKAKKTA
jgi:hypothetical protein